MSKLPFAAAAVCASLACPSFAHDSAPVDFARDVQPILRAHCIDCHGPKQQKNGFRLDRRKDAMRGGTAVMIGPGNSVGSKLYLRLTGDRYGQQMPPDGPLSSEDLNVIKAWIDQGARWPDELAGDTPSATPHPKAMQMMDALRNGNQRAFEKLLREDPNAAKLTGKGGSTPLMFAALYGNADSVHRLLDCGADPNTRNEVGATALMWAVDDVEKTRLLLKAGADANARSDDGRTPLLIATGWTGAGEVVKLLLDHGAQPSAKAYGIRGASTPLRQAADIGDEAVLRLLIERGAKVKDEGIGPLISAVNANCTPGVDLFFKAAEGKSLKSALISVIPPRGNPASLCNTRLIQQLLERGADPNAKDEEGRTVLMLAACSERVPLETVQALLSRGAEVHAKSARGETVLDFAKARGDATLVALLTKAGAKEGRASPATVVKAKPAGSVRAAIERSLPLLQRTDRAFLQKAACVSCHNNTMTAEAVAMARNHGIPVDEGIARQQLQSIAAYTETWRERRLQGFGSGGGAATMSFVLVGMAAEGHPPDAATDAWVRYLKGRQSKDGSWRAPSERPPLETGDIQVTAYSLRSLQVFGLKTQRSEYDKAVQLAANWLKNAQPKTTADRASQIRGLHWAGRQEEVVRKAAQGLAAEQRSDGGWGQLSTLASDAYATGQALVALRESGAVAATDPAYQRGIEFLLNTQLEDGSWYVRSRAIPIQPHFESGFPHGLDQWISAAATNWAVMALISAVR